MGKTSPAINNPVTILSDYCTVLAHMTPLESTLPKLAAKGQGENDQAASAIAHRTLPPRRRNAPVPC
jgi:hypothetical protein